MLLAPNTSSFKCLGTHISNTQKGCQHTVSSKSPAVSAPYLHCGNWKYSSVQSGTAAEIVPKKNLPKQTNSDPTHSAHHMYQRSHSPNILLEAEISRQRPDDPQLASSCARKESGVCHWHFTDQTVLQKKKEIVLMWWWWWWHTMQWDRDCLFRCVGMLNWYPMWYSRVLPSYLCPAWLSRLSVTNQVDPWTPHIPLKRISWMKAVCELYV